MMWWGSGAGIAGSGTIGTGQLARIAATAILILLVCRGTVRTTAGITATGVGVGGMFTSGKNSARSAFVWRRRSSALASKVLNFMCSGSENLYIYHIMGACVTWPCLGCYTQVFFGF